MQLNYRSFSFDKDTIDKENKIINVVFSAGTPVLKQISEDKYVYEEIQITPESIDLSEYNKGAPVLIDHNSSVKSMVGRTVPGSAFIRDGLGYVSVRLGNDSESDLIYQKICDGIIKDVSMGYKIRNAKFIRNKNKDHNTILVTDCLPRELSFVVFPADPHAGVREESLNLPLLLINIEGDILNMENTEPISTTLSNENVSSPKNLETRSINESTHQQIIDVEEIKKLEIQRLKEINDLVFRHNLEPSFSNQLFIEGLNLEQAKNKVLEKLAENSKKHSYVTGGTTVESIQHRNDSIANALLYRYEPLKFKLDHSSARFKDMSVLDIARYVTNSDYFTNKTELVQRSLTTTDFPLLLANVLNKKLAREYQAAPKTYAPIVTETEVSDFKPVVRLQMGDAPMMKPKPENSEYERGSLSESAETYSIQEYGSMIDISRKLILNDDLNALLRLTAKISRRAAELESNVVWNSLLLNPKMGDGIPIFDARHKNYAADKKTGAGPISVETIGAALGSMMLQTGLDGGLITIAGKYLIVPVALATKARQFLHSTSPTKDDDANPYKGSLELIIEPRLDRISTTAWYIASDIALIDLIEVAYLHGQKGLFMDSQPNFNTDGISLKCRLDIGAKVLDYRGFYKNEGVSA